MALNKTLIDGFNRVRTSSPYTLVSQNLIRGKSPQTIHETITGAGVSTYDENQSCVIMRVNGAGSVLRRSRLRSIYQPGKSLMIYMTGVLNYTNVNDTSVKSIY